MSAARRQSEPEENWRDLIQEATNIIAKRSPDTPRKDIVDAWGALSDIAEETRNHPDLLLPEFALLRLLFDSANCQDLDDCKDLIWTIVKRLCNVPENEQHFLLDDESTFPAAVVSTIQTNEELRAVALTVMLHLANVSANRMVLIQPQFRLLPVLSVLLQFDEDSFRMCCQIFLALCEDHTCGVTICATDSVRMALAAVLASHTAEYCQCALEVVNKLSLSEENRELLLIKDLGLVSLLLVQLRHAEYAISSIVCSILFNISKLPTCCLVLVDHKAELLVALVEVVRSSDAEGPGRVFALYTILNMAKLNNESRDYIGVADISLFSILVKIVQEPIADNNALIISCQLLNRLSFSKPARDKFLWDTEATDCDEDSEDSITRLVRALMVVIQSDEGIGRVVSCSFIWNIISDDSFGSYLLPLIPELIPILVGVITADNTTYARLKALGIMCNIIRYADNGLRAYVSLPEVGLLPAVADMVIHSSQCKPEEVQKSCNIIDALCFSESVSAYLMSSRLNLLPSLVQLLIDTSQKETVMHACSIFWNLSVHDGSGLLMKTLELNLIGELAAVVIREDKNLRYKSLGALCNLAVLPHTRQLIGSAALGLFPVLCDQIPITPEDKIRQLMLKLLSFLSLDSVVVEAMISAKLGLVEMLVKLVDEWDHEKEDFHKTIPTVLWNLSCVPSVNRSSADFYNALTLEKLVEWIEAGPKDMLQASVYIITNSIPGRLLCDPELPRQPGLAKTIATLRQVYVDDIGGLGDCAIGGLWNIAECPDSDAAVKLLNANVHVTVLEYVRTVGPDRSNWNRLKLASKSLNFLMNLSTHSAAISPMADAGTLEVILPIISLSSNGCECLKAMFIVAFLIGKDESKESVSLLHTRSDTIATLIQVLTDTLNEKEGIDYPAGTFCVKLIIQAVLALSVSDVNKDALLETNIVVLLRDVLKRFKENEPEIPHCGGGGADVDSASLSLDALLHLSFAYESEQDLQAKLMPPELGFLTILRDLIEDRDRLPPEAVRTAGQLLQRLLPVGEVYSSFNGDSSGGMNENSQNDTASAAVSGQDRRHIMISYCWDESARPDLVRKLAGRLRSLGYDIWLDAEGSTLVPPIGGCVDDCMAEAVQCSDTVIVCVSPKYKQSANCRMEATYACHLAKRGDLRLCFVMMDENYTTVTTPQYCDGWLGLMTGSALWYSLWDESLIDVTVQQLSILFGSRGKVQSTAAAAALPEVSLPEEVVLEDPSSSSVHVAGEASGQVDNPSVCDTSPPLSLKASQISDSMDSCGHDDDVTPTVTVEVLVPPSSSSPPLLRPTIHHQAGGVSPRDGTRGDGQRPTLTRGYTAPIEPSTGRPNTSNRMTSPFSMQSPSSSTNSSLFPSHSGTHFFSSSRAFQASGSMSTLGRPLNDNERSVLVQNMWRLLTNPEKVKDLTGLNAWLRELGVSEAEELEYCEPDHVQRISSYLLPVPQKMFVKKMNQLWQE